MNKLITIGIILLVVLGGGIYLGITNKINPIEKLNEIFQEEEKQEEPKGITIKEIVSGDNT